MTLYAVPFINPTGGTITRMGIQVTTGAGAGTGATCDLGIYSAVNGAPGALLLDSGTVNAETSGAKTNGRLNFLAQPNRMYFLTVGCNMGVAVEGTTNTGGSVGRLLGEPDMTSFGATSLTATWTSYSASHLPSTFPTPLSYGSATTVPNVYVGPT